MEEKYFTKAEVEEIVKLTVKETLKQLGVNTLSFYEK